MRKGDLVKLSSRAKYFSLGQGCLGIVFEEPEHFGFLFRAGVWWSTNRSSDSFEWVDIDDLVILNETVLKKGANTNMSKDTKDVDPYSMPSYDQANKAKKSTYTISDFDLHDDYDFLSQPLGNYPTLMSPKNAK